MTRERFVLKRTGTADVYNVQGFNNDPWFNVDEGPSDEIVEGDEIVVNPGTPIEETRAIFAITIVSSIGIKYSEILAPKQTSPPDKSAKYIKHYLLEQTGECELRPGTIIIGGRKTGFYDSEGIILSAQHYGGDVKRFEDWVYLVSPLADSSSISDSNWVTLNDIVGPIAGPNPIIDIDYRESRLRQQDADLVDYLIRSGEKELLDYLSISLGAIKELSPKQFEATVRAIFSQLGFAVEPIGTWNQADGGIDLLAVSKTLADTEVRIAIQCKASKNKISAKPIRELAGVIGKFKAHQGILATTSTFTEPARAETAANFWQISLEDRAALYNKIQSVLGNRAKSVSS